MNRHDLTGNVVFIAMILVALFAVVLAGRDLAKCDWKPLAACPYLAEAHHAR